MALAPVESPQDSTAGLICLGPGSKGLPSKQITLLASDMGISFVISHKIRLPKWCSHNHSG